MRHKGRKNLTVSEKIQRFKYQELVKRIKKRQQQIKLQNKNLIERIKNVL